MYKILFLDDEKSVIDYLPHAIDWAMLGVTELFTATDAERALQIVERERPDIAIADVEMPGKDGLEFCREARRICPTIKFVILSAFDRFDYAKRAIAIGVDDYLLKPVDEQELGALMDRIVKQISGSRREKMNRKAAEVHLLEKAARELFRDMLQGRGQTLGTGQELGFAAQYHNLCIFMQTDSNLSVCRHILHQSFAEDSVFLTLEKGFFAVLWKKNIRESGLQEAEKIRERLRDEGVRTLLAFVQTGEKESLSNAFIRCFTELEKQFYRCSEKWQGQERAAFRTTSLKAPELNEGMEQLSGKGETTLLRESVHRALDAAFEQYAEPVSICSMMLDVLITIKIYLTKYWQNESVDLFRKIGNDTLLRCGSPENMRDMIDRYLEDLQFFVRKQKKEHGNFYIIKIAKEYTKAHYQDSTLSLQDVADAAGTSRTYFSRVFRELTGEKYWDYLSRYRIAKAKELLTQTNMGQAEISLKVGYESEFHFSRKFKEIAGISPNKFRKQ